MMSNNNSDTQLNSTQSETGPPSPSTVPESLSAGSSDALVEASTNEEILLVATEVNGIIKLMFSDDRPDTALDKKTQGDHATAYVNFLQMIVMASDGKGLKASAELIRDAAIAILPEKRTLFNEIFNKRNFSEQVLSKETRRKIIRKLQEKSVSSNIEPLDPQAIKINKEALISHTRKYYMELMTEIGTTFLREINLNEEVAFTRVGERDKEEGPRVKGAFHTLKALNDLEELSSKEIKEEDVNNKFNYIYNNYIKSNATYIQGINKVFQELSPNGNHKEFDSIRNSLKKSKQNLSIAEKKRFLGILANKYTEVKNSSQSAIHNEDTSLTGQAVKTRKSKSIPSVEKSYENKFSKLISDSFGNLFDFKYENHSDATDVVDLLEKVTARHIVSMYRAYSSLRSLQKETKNEIMNKFLKEQILERQGWTNYDINIGDSTEVKSLTIDNLREGVHACYNLEDFKMKSKDKAEESFSAIDNALITNQKIDERKSRPPIKQMKKTTIASHLSSTVSSDAKRTLTKDTFFKQKKKSTKKETDSSINKDIGR